MESVSQEEAGLDLVRGGTLFADPETERRYRTWQIEKAVPFNRAGMLASIANWAIILAVVGFFLPAGFATWAAAVGVVIAAILGSLAIISRRALWSWMPASVMLANTFAGMVSVAILNYHVGSLEGSVLSATIVGYFGFVIFRLRPMQAAVAVAPYMVWTAWFLIAEPAGGRQLAGGISVLWMAGLFIAYSSGLIGCVVFDMGSRQSYRQERIIEAQKRTIAFERARSETLLKQEISHQVAERSRELGQMLAKIEASLVVGALSAGDRFDKRYRVLRALGSGGMGSVYEVERLTDEQRLALKIVTGEVSGAQAARFAREAEIGARVQHRNLVSIVDVGIAEGVPFLVMELASHGSLDDQRERFGDPAWALPILAEIAGGLAALHASGIVHRDLKPANVLFTKSEDGTVVAKISDFGISTFGAFGSSGVDPTGATIDRPSQPARGGLTATGTLLGTPYYMAPESVRGAHAVQTPADAFAFGILACEMLEGRAPFTTPPIFFAMAGEPIPPPTPHLDARVDPALRDALLACLAEDPTKRPTMQALVSLLRDQAVAKRSKPRVMSGASAP